MIYSNAFIAFRSESIFIRVIPSITPLLQIEGNLDRHGHGMYDLMNARGAHEIVIESPRHVNEYDLPKEQVTKSLNVILDSLKIILNCDF